MAKWISAANIVVNLFILFLFKYYDFFVTSFAEVFLGGKTEGLLLKIILPVGISFYTVFFAIHFDSNAGTFFDNFVWHDVEVSLNFFIIEFAANKAFDAINGVFGVRNTLTLSDFTDKAFAFFGDGHNRWRGTIAFAVSDDLWLASDHVGESAVSCT